MTADELRLLIAELLEEETDAHVEVQGKRVVVTDDEDVTVILVTPATRAKLARERRERLAKGDG